MNLASRNRRSEDVRIHPIVVTELELGDVQRQIFLADFVETADDATLEDRPKPFDGLSVNCADDVLPTRMIDGDVRKLFVEMLVSDPLVGTEQTDFRGNGLANELGERRGLHILNHASDHVALSAYGTRDDNFTRTASSAAAIPALALVSVLGFAADEGFVHFDDAHEFAEIFIRQPSPDAMAHIPSRAIGAGADHPMDLKRANALFAGQHEVDNPEPCFEGHICVLENRSDRDREPIAIRRTCPALPVERLVVRGVGNLRIAATGTMDALGPPLGPQESLAGVIVGEKRLQLRDGHLRGDLSLLGAGHDGSPCSENHIALKHLPCQVVHNRQN